MYDLGGFHRKLFIVEGEGRWRKKSPECFATQSSERKTGIAFDLSIWEKKK